MEGNGLGVLSDIEINKYSSVEGQLLEVGLESDMVVPGDDVGGEKLASLNVDPTCHFGSGMCSAHVVSAV